MTQEKSPLYALTEKASAQMMQDLTDVKRDSERKGIKLPSNYSDKNASKSRTAIFKELERLYAGFQSIVVGEPYSVSGGKCHGNATVFSLKSSKPLEAEVNFDKFGSKFQENCLKLIQPTPSMEISNVPAFKNVTQIFYSSKMEQIKPDSIEEKIQWALESLKVQTTPTAEVESLKVGVPTERCSYALDMTREQLAMFTKRFLSGENIHPELVHLVKEQHELY